MEFKKYSMKLFKHNINNIFQAEISQNMDLLEQLLKMKHWLWVSSKHLPSCVLQTLDADYSKNQDALLGVLCQMTSGKSFELVLAAAAATGKLQSFAIKLIKWVPANQGLS